jgi:hypothetical protein
MNNIFTTRAIVFWFMLLCANTKAQNIFPATGKVGIGTTTPLTLLQVKGGGSRFGSLTNYVNIDTGGSITFTGSAFYKFNSNRYVFRYTGTQAYGLYFSLANTRYELRDSNGAASAMFGANDGNVTFKGGVKVGNSTSAVAGNIRWNGSDFQGYTGGVWKSLTAGVNDWGLTGNAGTSSVTNFIGTTDAQPLVFKVNNARAGYIDYDFSKSNTSFGYQSLINNTTGNFNTANGFFALFFNSGGTNNTAQGSYSLLSNTTGDYNEAVGSDALHNNITGSNNTANGAEALYSNTAGLSNTASGAWALQGNATGGFNVATGAWALSQNAGGNDNVATGMYSAANTQGNSNVAIGSHSLYNNTAGSNLVAIGDSSLYSQGVNAQGYYYNTAVGSKALYSNTSGFDNTATGYQSLYLNTTGAYNTATGMLALNANTTGVNNTATGVGALQYNVTGYSNTAHGIYTLYLNNSGQLNTVTGFAAMFSNISGSQNMAAGEEALYSNTIGNNNVAIGPDALYHNSAGSHIVAIGDSALYNQGFNPSGNYYNTAVGSRALYKNTTGYANTAVGYNSLNLNDIGTQNTAVGVNALFNNTSGHDNIAVGEQSSAGNTTGNANVAIGTNALFANMAGYGMVAIGYGALSQEAPSTDQGGYFLETENTAIGYSALTSNTVGSSNTATGYQSLYQNIAGSGNTAYGALSLTDNQGSGNTSIGAGNMTDTYGRVNYCTAIGSNIHLLPPPDNGWDTSRCYNTTVIGTGIYTTGSDIMVLGNVYLKSVVTNGNYVSYSDGRFKKNIQANVPGLAFISQLRPVTYNYDVRGLKNHFSIPEKTATNAQNTQQDRFEDMAVTAKEKIVYTGFVAQEVEQAAKKINYNFSGVYKPQNDKDVYGLSYGDFVVPLVKAVQELNTMNDSKQSQIDSLKIANTVLQKQLQGQQLQIDALKTLMLSIQQKQDACSPCANVINNSSTVIADGASLEQNAPNPFNHTTSIGYTLPQSFTTAQIIITDKNGKTLKIATVSGSGKGRLSIDASVLAAGAYNYSLLVDGKLIGTKQMVLAR